MSLAEPGTRTLDSATHGNTSGIGRLADRGADAIVGWRDIDAGRVRTWIAITLLLPILLAAAMPGVLAPFDPFANVGRALVAPDRTYVFGTDDLGRDQFSGVVWGARTSLLIGMGTALLSIVIGTSIGVAAGTLGGWIDEALMRFTEIIMLLPRFFIALLVATLFGASLVNICLVLGLTGWPGLARIARAEAMAQRGREHVMAAIALGASDQWIMTRHILPAVRPLILSLAAPIITTAILTEASLSYLGLGDPNWISWGKLIHNGQTFFNQGWWLSLFPGLAVVMTCVGLALAIDGQGK